MNVARKKNEPEYRKPQQVIARLQAVNRTHASKVEASTLRPLLGGARAPGESYFLSDVTAFLVGAYLGVPDLRREALSGAIERETSRGG